MNKNIGILAHVDAGKTTFSEQLLFHAKSIKQAGRVDHQNTFLDNHEIEKQRGITVFSGQASFRYNGCTYYLLDTPGHVDFSPEMERAILAMDFAVLIISAVEGIEGHTETIWELLKKHRIPTFFFINKMDREGADAKKVIQDIRNDLALNAFDITASFNDGKMEEELIEFLAEQDEMLFEYYLEYGYDTELWLKKMIEWIKDFKIFPCASGSALQNQGIDSFLQKLDLLTATDYKGEGHLSGRIFKIRHEPSGTRIAFMKVLRGTLKVRDSLYYGDKDHIKEGKVTQIRLYNGEKYTISKKAGAGQLIAVTGLPEAKIGDSVGILTKKSDFSMVPALRSRVVFEHSANPREVLKEFKILEAEDPSLNVVWDEKFQEIHIHVMGMIQLEVLVQIAKERFGRKIHFEPPEILYKETIASEVTGCGHFEPLRHYAEVHLKLEPLRRNSGIRFESVCSADDLTVASQNLIKQHIFERDHHGLLTGSPLTDVKVTLLTGRDHEKHTSGGDFREAAFRALRQALEKADNILLEPYYSFKIKVDLNHMGKILTDIQAANGKFDPPETEDNKAVITGTVPVSTFKDYGTVFKSYTSGKGMLNLAFAGYERCHNEQEVIARIGYDKDADLEYTSSSIFCSKGKSFSVPWDEAEGMMHCLK